MKRLWRCTWAVGALLTLVGYLLSDIQLVGDTDFLTWEEFSANPTAISRFGEHAASDPLQSALPGDLHRAYENYLAAQRRPAESGTFSGGSSGSVALLKDRWHAVYRFFTPKSGSHPRHGRARSGVFRERLGIGLTLATIVGAILLLSWGNRRLEGTIHP